MLFIKPVLSGIALPKLKPERTKKKQGGQSSEPTLILPTVSALAVATLKV